MTIGFEAAADRSYQLLYKNSLLATDDWQAYRGRGPVGRLVLRRYDHFPPGTGDRGGRAGLGSLVAGILPRATGGLGACRHQVSNPSRG